MAGQGQKPRLLLVIFRNLSIALGGLLLLRYQPLTPIQDAQPLYSVRTEWQRVRVKYCIRFVPVSQITTNSMA